VKLFALGLALTLGCSSSSGADVDSGTTAIEDSAGTEDVAVDSGARTDGAADAADASSASPATKLVVEPEDGDAPILAAIASAKKTLHLEVYLLTDSGMISALKKAKSRGVDVQVVLEQKPFGMAGANDAAQSSLSSAGIAVHWANDALYTLTHAKFMVLDGATLIVMTMNLSSSAFSGNREYAIFDLDPADVAEAESIFAADASGASLLPTGKLVVSPTNSEKTLEDLIDSAASTLDIEVETLGDSKIDDRLIAAAGRGVKVRIVVSDSSSTTTASSVAALAAKGIQVKKLGTPTVHAKAIVVDSARAYVGSENLTTQSLVYNREVGLVTATGPVVARIASTVAADYLKGTAY
jgi:phosphatidylserine/phosphatidylglycerophosphate/cardiolipin synthase-like enzyme